MRVLVDLAERLDGPFIVISAPGQASAERPVRWTAGRRLLVARDEAIKDDDATALADSVDRGGEGAAEVERYGRLLYEAAFGANTWHRLVAAAAGQPYLELAIRGGTDEGEGPAAALQALRWEAIHDGDGHVAARGATPGGQAARATAGNGDSGHSRPLPVGIVRLVTAMPPAGHDAPGGLPRISRIPRVLFAIGSRLTDPRVRAGAEFMGILRHLERNGGSIQPRLIESATVPSLTDALRSFQPDVLHVIGHGRWFPVDGCVKLQVSAESGSGDDWVTAEGLLGIFADAPPAPTVVVLSACQTASAGQWAEPVNALPFAARLVAGGVPVVIAMAGDISDTACRVFTRALTQAIGESVPLADAVIRGRRAAFYARPDLDSTDWMLPAIFLAEHLSADTSMVDTAAIRAARDRIRDLDLAWEPVFCGRADFVADLDLLLDATEPLNVLVACTPDGRNSYGGLRLLRELAARAVRASRLPVLLGPYDKDPPASRAEFAEGLSDKLDEIRDNLGVAPRRNGIIEAAAAARTAPLASAILEAFDDLAEDLPETDPVRASPLPRTILLCHRVDEWGEDALADLLAMLGPRGLGSSKQHRVPVVLTGADTGLLAEARVRLGHAEWARFAALGRFRSDDADPEDILAYQWWLLNPPERTPVYAPRRGVDESWQGVLRKAMGKTTLADQDELFGWVKVLSFFFTSDMDGDILDSYSRAAP
jgi:hypothetical protein